ncbi:pyrroline-5-carboxylate reductase [Anaerobacterium chartisolvens]|uniref:Pyrroline-5-carboxylate reductase n=1 Tax=Anaerobacterium chartisolvens TaxID=1297424 RepID=A0A369BCM6_9FIRM|nr:pyrroline-5-carboxylate reductase [Anaerobacterium chartisolvens]RCX19302.1 pyrroline-5-carboxylate reductase [Anaerobacterium chartisolvens]
MDITLGFIGTGAMGSAMIKSVSCSEIMAADSIKIYDTDSSKTSAISKETGVGICGSAVELVRESDIIVLAVKPNILEGVLNSIKDVVDDKKIIVSFAVGIPISFYKNIVGKDKKVVRTMPNTPMQVNEGMTLISYDGSTQESEIEIIKKLFECTGRVEVLDEKLMSEVTALTGSSPAYVYMFIEAMADAAVQSGIPRALAYRLAAQAVLGSAKMVLETGRHPGELKDQVCSPAGTTIEAVSALEKNGFRHAVMDAMGECTKRAREIGKIYG